MKEQISKKKFILITTFGLGLAIALKFLLPNMPSNSMLKEAFWAEKVSQKAQYDIVFVGDSRVYRGIDPEVFESVYKYVKSFNFGFSSAGLDTFLIGKACKLLNPEGKRILVLAISPNSFLPSSLKNAHIKSILKQDTKSIWIKKHMYPELTFFNSIAFSDLFKIAKGESYMEIFHYGKGYVASSKSPEDSNAAIEAYRMQFERETIDTLAVNQFVKTLKALRQEKIRIYFIRLPVSNSMKNLEDEMSNYFYDRLSVKLQKLGIKDLTISNLTWKTYDGSHLKASSAEKFSKALAEKFIKY